MSVIRLPVALAATLSCLAVTAPAIAAPFESNGRTAEVRYHDLDLTSADGQKALSRRITAAANKVCRSYSSQDEQGLCRKLAVRNVRAPIASAIAQAQVKGQLASAVTPDLTLSGGK